MATIGDNVRHLIQINARPTAGAGVAAVVLLGVSNCTVMHLNEK